MEIKSKHSSNNLKQTPKRMDSAEQMEELLLAQTLMSGLKLNEDIYQEPGSPSMKKEKIIRDV